MNNDNKVHDDQIILKCGYLYPVINRPEKNYGIVINSQDSKIIDMGRWNDIISKYSSYNKILDYSGFIIMPALTNAHIHFYFSAFTKNLYNNDDFVSWIQELVNSPVHLDSDAIITGIKQTIKQQYDSGVSLVGNICTNPELELPIYKHSKLRGVLFLETVGFKESESEMLFRELTFAYNNSNNDFQAYTNWTIALAPHALYSVSRKLVEKISDFNNKKGLISTIHLAESKDEVLFLKGDRNNSFISFLEDRELIEVGWSAPAQSTVQYLESTNFLNRKSLIVHAVHVDEKDCKILKENDSNIIVCLGSNLHLGVGVPDVEMFLSQGLNVALGTDSMASNPLLNIFNEMKLIKKHFPKLEYKEIIKMATLNGAKALGYEKDYGSIEIGKKADLLAIKNSHGKLVNLKPIELENLIVCEEKKITRVQI